ncbi:max-binding MNT-like [Brachionus plicatilis]|uniref:Max-binding MNT-like n=1 Tax=Brachionus plicatilis TaxID=10195 RepID=A0A3M7RE79_BRAPC|nr:max-binding MNT-like [Brachionus plicatilis]
MDNIDVLLKAAEFIELQGCLVNERKAHNHLNLDSSLSPISSVSYSSSSSSSLFNSPNNSNNLANNDQNLLEHKINVKPNAHWSLDQANSNVYSSSLPSNFVSSSSHFCKSRKNDQTTSTINQSMSRLEEMKRDKAIHNTLEKNRRAHLKGCFEQLQNELPQYKDKKCTNLAILNYTLKFIELSKKKTKENELEKKRLLEEQFRLKKQLAQLTLDFKSEYLQKCGDNCVDQANGKFKSILQSLNIDAHPNDQVNNFQIDFDQKQNSYSNTATSPKQIVAKYYRKRSSNSLSMITGIKTIQPTQSHQLQLQNHLKIQKCGKRLNGQQRHRHYSVDDSIMDRQRIRKKTVSTSRNDFEASVDEENDDFDDEHSIDETNTTLDYDIDSNSLADKDLQVRDRMDDDDDDDNDNDNDNDDHDDEESRGLVINEDEQETSKVIKEETIDIETLSDKSNSPASGHNSVNIFEKKNVPQMIVKNGCHGLNAQTTSIDFSNYQSSNFLQGMLSKTANRAYINASLISNVQNLNLKSTVQESTSANSSFNMNIKQIKLNASLYQKQKQTNVNPK